MIYFLKAHKTAKRPVLAWYLPYIAQCQPAYVRFFADWQTGWRKRRDWPAWSRHYQRVCPMSWPQCSRRISRSSSVRRRRQRRRRIQWPSSTHTASPGLTAPTRACTVARLILLLLQMLSAMLWITTCRLHNTRLADTLNKLCGRPPQYAPRPLQVDLWPFDLESGVRVTCDVGYLCANFCLPGPLCSRLRPDVRGRQTSAMHHRVMPRPCPRGGAL